MYNTIMVRVIKGLRGMMVACSYNICLKLGIRVLGSSGVVALEWLSHFFPMKFISLHSAGLYVTYFTQTFEAIWH